MRRFACPECHASLDEAASDVVVCSCGRRYPVLHRLPILHLDAEVYCQGVQSALREHLAALRRCDDLWARVLSERCEAMLAALPEPRPKASGKLDHWVSHYVSTTELNERIRWAYGPYASPLHEGHAEGLYATLFRLAHACLKGRSGTKALEVGCGEGRNLLELSRLTDEVVGVDASFSQVFQAQRILCDAEPWRFFFRAPTKPEYLARDLYTDTYFLEGRVGPFELRNVRLAVADATALPFVAGAFDLVVFVNALNYASDPERAILEARRVLRADGAVLIAETFSFSIHEKLTYPAPERAMNNRHDLTRLLAQAGLALSDSFVTTYECRPAEGRDEIWQVHFFVAKPA